MVVPDWYAVKPQVGHHSGEPNRATIVVEYARPLPRSRVGGRAAFPGELGLKDTASEDGSPLQGLNVNYGRKQVERCNWTHPNLSIGR